MAPNQPVSLLAEIVATQKVTIRMYWPEVASLLQWHQVHAVYCKTESLREEVKRRQRLKEVEGMSDYIAKYSGASLQGFQSRTHDGLSFSDLPAEIRYKVYSYLFAEHNHFDSMVFPIFFPKRLVEGELALYQASKVDVNNFPRLLTLKTLFLSKQICKEVCHFLIDNVFLIVCFENDRSTPSHPRPSLLRSHYRELEDLFASRMTQVRHFCIIGGRAEWAYRSGTRYDFFELLTKQGGANVKDIVYITQCWEPECEASTDHLNTYLGYLEETARLCISLAQRRTLMTVTYREEVLQILEIGDNPATLKHFEELCETGGVRIITPRSQEFADFLEERGLNNIRGLLKELGLMQSEIDLLPLVRD